MTVHPDALAELRKFLSGHGGYLRNTLRIPNITCSFCACPIKPSFSDCYKCSGYRSMANTADLAGSMIYGVEGKQSDRLMYGYKSAAPGPTHRLIVSALVVLGIREHKTCANKLVGIPATRWATVPSLRKQGSVHPLRTILRAEIAPGSEIDVVANFPNHDPRGVTPTNFSVPQVDAGTHVLIIDDTWTSGGHAQSVSVALKNAGAARVSVLTVSRWIKPTDPLSAAFLRDHVDPRQYDPACCPWTGGACP